MRKIILLIFQFLLFGINFKAKKKFVINILKNKNQDVQKKLYGIKDYIEEYISIKYNSNKLLDTPFNYNLAVGQFIYNHFIQSSNFNYKIIFQEYLGETFFYPLPKEYLKLLKDKGIRVNFLISSLLFNCLLIFGLIFFIGKSIIYIYYGINNCIKKKNCTVVYLDSVSNIFVDLNLSKFPNFFDWVDSFLRKNKCIEGKILFIHNNKNINSYKIDLQKYDVEYVKEFLFCDLNITKYFKSFFKTIIIIFTSSKEKILILDDILKNEYVKKNKIVLPDYAFFNNSSIIFQPSWSKSKNNKNEYLAYLYFYSINITPIIKNPEFSPNLFGYRMQSWINYIFWNSAQKNWVEHCSKRKINKIIINSYIPFEGKDISVVKNYNKRKIAIFDVVPKNDEIYYSYLHVYNIYTKRFCEKFFLDIVNSLKIYSTKYDLFYKSKRNLQSIHPEYKELITNHLNKNSNFHIINSEVSAQSLIMDCDMSISMPFTSTGEIANTLKKPYIYYFPNGNDIKSKFFQKNVVFNSDELLSWLKKNEI